MAVTAFYIYFVEDFGLEDGVMRFCGNSPVSFGGRGV
jgi:hypothetical protein